MIYLRAYARGNLGDDLFIREICNKYKNEKFFLLADKKYKKVFKDIKNLKIMHYYYKKMQKNKNNYDKWSKLNSKFLKRLSKKCATYLYIGGSIFIENEAVGLTAMKELKKEVCLFKKAYIVGANFGPYINKEYLNYIHDELIPSLNHISFRDKDSYNLFKDLKNTSYAPDLIFSLKKPMLLNDKTKEVGISIIHHLEREYLKKNYNYYLQKLTDISIEYIKKGFTIRILSFCEYEKDPVAINDFINKMPVEYIKNVKIDYYNGDINSFLETIFRLDTIIATRFHSIVLGLKSYCNVIPICYSNKSINLLNDLGIKKYVTFDNIQTLLESKSIKLEEQQLKKLEKESRRHYIPLKFK